MFRSLALVLSSAILFSACQPDSPAVEEHAEETTQRSIEAVADEYLAAMLERFPTLATSLSLEGVRHDRLVDNSLEALSEWQTREDVWLAELEAIGEQFDIRDFHDRILENGSMTLPMTEKAVLAWIERTKQE